MLLTALDLDVVSSAGISISDCGGSKEGVAVDGVDLVTFHNVARKLDV